MSREEGEREIERLFASQMADRGAERIREAMGEEAGNEPLHFCPICHGTGRTPIAYPVDNEAHALATAAACPACDGTGEAADPDDAVEEAKREAYAEAMGEQPQGEEQDAEWDAHESAVR